MKHIHTPSLLCYTATHGTLIPLHKYDAQSARNGTIRKDGKRPVHTDWTKRPYNSGKVLAICQRDNLNVGVRLPADIVVIDIDPRNGGNKGWDDITMEYGIDESIFPCTITGSGGRHYWARKPADVPVRDTLEDFPGVEFKSKGRQVVAAGSIHPESQELYRWDDNAPASSDIPEMPEALLRAITRPQRPAVSSGGQLDQEQAEVVLARLDPLDFNTNERWLKLMMALHHATHGDARQEWIDWSISDPAFRNDAEWIGRRWDSLHTDKGGDAIVTIGTLRHFLSEAKALDVLPPDTDQAAADFADADDPDMVDDFEEPRATASMAKPKRNPVLPSDDDDGVSPENESGFTDKAVSVLSELNSIYTCVLEGGKFRVLECKDDPVMLRNYWERTAKADFENYHNNRRIERDISKLGKGASPTMKLGTAWMEWEGRNTVKSVVFDPQKEHPGCLNLWQGYAYEPRTAGSWKYLYEMTHECLCDGDDKVFKYVMNWMAFMFQRPSQRAEAAVMFKGRMGIGKGTLGNALVRAIGRHAIAIGSPDLITGRFNAHLQDVLFLFADEAVKPYDKAAESKMKHLITEQQISIEPKGMNAHMVKNIIHIMMATNERWAIAADQEDERRYVVCDANAKWMGKKDKWTALYKELESGGYSRMIHDLMNHRIPAGWHPRNLVYTKALVDQQIRNQTPMRQWLYNACVDGLWPVQCIEGADQWEKRPIRFFYEDFKQAFHGWCKHTGIAPGGMGRSNTKILLGDLTDTFPAINTRLRVKVPDDSLVQRSASDGRAQAVELPSLPDCRADFDRIFKGPQDWNANTEDDFDFN